MYICEFGPIEDVFKSRHIQGWRVIWQGDTTFPVALCNNGSVARRICMVLNADDALLNAVAVAKA